MAGARRGARRGARLRAGLRARLSAWLGLGDGLGVGLGDGLGEGEGVLASPTFARAGKSTTGRSCRIGPIIHVQIRAGIDPPVICVEAAEGRDLLGLAVRSHLVHADDAHLMRA